MVLIGKGRLGPNIWPETADYAKSTENMIRVVWAKKAYHWQKASETKTIALSFSTQEARHVSLLTFYYMPVMLLIWA